MFNQSFSTKKKSIKKKKINKKKIINEKTRGFFISAFVSIGSAGEYVDVIEAELAVTIDVSWATQRTPRLVGRRR